MKRGKRRCAKDAIFVNAMNGHIVRVKIILRIHVAGFRTGLTAILESDHPDLADAGHARIGDFDVDRNEFQDCPLNARIRYRLFCRHVRRAFLKDFHLAKEELAVDGVGPDEGNEVAFLIRQTIAAINKLGWRHLQDL